jgi:hypothetical protein
LNEPFDLLHESALRWKKWESKVDNMADAIGRKPRDIQAEEIEFKKAYVYYKTLVRRA